LKRDKIYKTAFLLYPYTHLLPLYYSDTLPFFKISDVGANLCAHLNIARIVEILKFMVRNLTLSLQNFKFRRLTSQQDYHIKPARREHATNESLNSAAHPMICRKQLLRASGQLRVQALSYSNRPRKAIISGYAAAFTPKPRRELY
jgi:hypothetical protein